MPTEEDLKKYEFNEPEYAEEGRNQAFVFTGFPKPSLRYRLFYEGYNVSIEEPYFWILHYLRYYSGFSSIDKITDVFAAAENSAFFGSAQQRLGAQQEKASQYLATIGKMVRELFQLVRELRILDERLDYYVDSFQAQSRSRESAEITLKGIWIDMVEQGAKNPASVYGMAREVQFTTLPDLFFSTHPLRQEDVDMVVDSERGQFNRKVKEVLKRKLRAFLAWKEHTFEELKNRRVFTLKFLRQHYEIIRMYMAWVRPYLRNIQRLQLDQRKTETPDLLIAFETSMIEIELLARRPYGTKKYPEKGSLNSVILMHYMFRTRPDMNYSQEYQRGPLHVGRVEINFRAYVWTDKEIENYKKAREQEDFQLLGVVDASVNAAMESLGDELMRYLREAGDDVDKAKADKKAVVKSKSIADPYLSIFKGFSELFSKGKKALKAEKLKPDDIVEMNWNKGEAVKAVTDNMWVVYHHFKKHHVMLNW